MAQKELFEKALKLKIIYRPQKDKKELMKLVELTAKENLKQYLSNQNREIAKLIALQKLLGIKKEFKKIECIDISHTQGYATIGACVVFSNSKPDKSQYRQFIIKNIKAGDDPAAIGQVLKRRLNRLIKSSSTLPDLIIIDGGIIQLKKAKQIIENLMLDIPVISVVKGEKRKVGLEKIISINKKGEVNKVKISLDNLAMKLIIQIRDEAHRFAIKHHKKRRIKLSTKSILDTIAGIGETKKEALLNHFGSVDEIKKSQLNELYKIDGINKILAQNILNKLNQ